MLVGGPDTAGGTVASGGGGGLSVGGFPPGLGVTGSGITAGRSGIGMLLPGTDGAMDGPRSAEYIRSPATPTDTNTLISIRVHWTCCACT